MSARGFCMLLCLRQLRSTVAVMIGGLGLGLSLGLG